MTATDRARFFTGEYEQPSTPVFRLRYRAFNKPRPSVFRLGRNWYGVIPTRRIGERAERYDTFHEAVHETHRLFEEDRAAWTSEYEPDYSAAELPPVDQLRALLQAAWA